MQIPEATTRSEPALATGVWAPVLTPLDDALAIDAHGAIAHMQWLLRHGCHGVVLFGTTGEGTSFSVEERMALLDDVLSAGVDPDRIMVGTGCCALSDTVRLTSHAAEHGCKQVLVLPPFYYKSVSDEGLYRSYAAVIDRVADDDLRLFFYHFPRQSATPLSEALIARLSERYPAIVAGVKDSSGVREHALTLMRQFPHLAIFPGSETLLLEGLRQGAAGCISATANVNPHGIRQVYDACRRADASADAAQRAATDVRRVIEGHPMCAALKSIVARFRDEPGWAAVRPPLVPLAESAAQALQEGLEQLGFALPD